MNAESLKQLIRSTFTEARWPGEYNLRGSDAGSEPYEAEELFRHQRDWRKLDAAFFDESPSGYGWVLLHLSSAAFRFYLPAFLIADIDERLPNDDVLFCLAYAFEDKMFKRTKTWNNGLTHFQSAAQLTNEFSRNEVAAIIAFLEFKFDCKNSTCLDQRAIAESLKNYWRPRLAELESPGGKKEKGGKTGSKPKRYQKGTRRHRRPPMG